MRAFSAAVLGLLLFAVPAFADAAALGSLEAIEERLERWDVEGASREVRSLLAAEPRTPETLELAARVALHRGEYAEARRLIQAALELDPSDEERKGFALFVDGTLAAVTPLTRHETPHFLLYLDEQRDGILVEYVRDALEATYRVMGERYGFRPSEKIRVELFPDSKAFYRATSLSVRDIEVAGAVGIAEFNKLMVLSPRALLYGYRWLDALSHEYMHYLIMKVSANRAPIWFHEGLAKFEETRWRSGPSYLGPLYRTLLAQALAADRLIDFVAASNGEASVGQWMRQMAAAPGKGARDILQELTGFPFPQFLEKWKASLGAKGLQEVGGVQVRRLKVKEGKEDEEQAELAAVRSAVARNRVHLADRLKERGRAGAAVIEYRRALADVGDSVPVLNRLSDALSRLGRDREAVGVLREAERIDPDHPTTFTRLGRIYLKLEELPKAREALEASLQLNPFNPEPHRNLAEVLSKLGDERGALRERDVYRRLTR
ncbi:MAG: tetratricopeptide repeat protein [Deltaproteobacteria bacterium]|nr:tetratricopeptide repeat protein [Deltaproteobacteria bacterium]